MENYPRNLKEFDTRFGSEEACREYLLHLRWPDGFRCPRCGCRESSPVRAVLLRCRDCRHPGDDRRSKSRGKLFFPLVQQALAVEPVPLDRILQPGAKLKPKPQPEGAW